MRLDQRTSHDSSAKRLAWLALQGALGTGVVELVGIFAVDGGEGLGGVGELEGLTEAALIEGGAGVVEGLAKKDAEGGAAGELVIFGMLQKFAELAPDGFFKVARDGWRGFCARSRGSKAEVFGSAEKISGRARGAAVHAELREVDERGDGRLFSERSDGLYAAEVLIRAAEMFAGWLAVVFLGFLLGGLVRLLVRLAVMRGRRRVLFGFR